MSCETNEQCGLRAECVALKQNEPKQCWCVSDLEHPDPKSGGCLSRSSGYPQDHIKMGVLLPDHIKDIFLTRDGNLTSSRAYNETSSMTLLPTSEHSSIFVWPHVILPIFVSFVIVIIIIFSIIYRRQLLIKQYRINNINGNSFVRTNDGVMLLDRMNTIINNPTYICASNVLSKGHNVLEVPCEHLKLLEVVGEGAFGQVFRGELFIPTSESYRQVAVKVLKDMANFEAQEDFEREVETMATFDHDNILKLLGVVIQGTDGSPCMIFEFMEHGDLSELLRKNDPCLRSPEEKYIICNKVNLVDFSMQIANGMGYLSEHRFVHRDLATRNCLVGGGLVVKIADFGMSRDIYTNDYYRVGCSRMLPVRWMSPEAIKYGRFTCESDIWAYGVVLWEIFSYGKQPYCGHTNEEVIHFLDQGIILQRPDDCPSTVYHVMLGCWKIDPRQRITFERVVKYMTDFRRILSKPQQVLRHHHQEQEQQPNPGIDVSSSVSNFDAGDCVVDIESNVDVSGGVFQSLSQGTSSENDIDDKYVYTKRLQKKKTDLKNDGFENLFVF